METSPEFRHLSVDEAGDVKVVQALDRRLSHQQDLIAFTQELSTLAQQDDVLKVLLDLAKVEYASSLLLAKLITLKQQLTDRGGQLVLCNLQTNLRRVFAITRLKTTFTIKEDVAEGLSAFDSGSGE